MIDLIEKEMVMDIKLIMNLIQILILKDVIQEEIIRMLQN